MNVMWNMYELQTRAQEHESLLSEFINVGNISF